MRQVPLGGNLTRGIQVRKIGLNQIFRLIDMDFPCYNGRLCQREYYWRMTIEWCVTELR